MLYRKDNAMSGFNWFQPDEDHLFTHNKLKNKWQKHL